MPTDIKSAQIIGYLTDPEPTPSNFPYVLRGRTAGLKVYVSTPRFPATYPRGGVLGIVFGFSTLRAIWEMGGRQVAGGRREA
jgi:hypothetical protein